MAVTMKRHVQNLTRTRSSTDDDDCCNGKCKENTKSGLLKQKQNPGIIQEIKLQYAHERIKNLEREITKRINEQISSLTDGVLGEIERFDDDSNSIIFNGKAVSEHHNRNHEFEKRFVSRASPLSELMEVRHIRSLYHMFIAALIISLVSGAVENILSGGWQAIRIGIRHVPAAFGQADRAIFLWIVMFIATCSVHPLLTTWIRFRYSLKLKRQQWYYDRLCLLLLVISICIMNSVVVYKMGWNMGPASGAFVLLEQTRFLMKTHAFVRSNVTRTSVPTFSQFFYFLFAPTLIYRDSYPRTPQIRWRFIGSCLVEFFGAVLMLSCVMELHVLPEFGSFGLRKQTPGSLATSISRTVLPASLFTLCGFYLFLHAWLNAWAEALRFADRWFYGVWWNATSYSQFYRTWNCVVHDYLHTYIYRDVRTVTGSPAIGRLAVFAVSALVHEYIIALMLGFCYPVMFVQFFGLGAALGFVRGAAGSGRCANIFLWVSLACGVGLQISLYSMESFARINCPIHNATFVDYFLPRSWSCNGLTI